MYHRFLGQPLLPNAQVTNRFAISAHVAFDHTRSGSHALVTCSNAKKKFKRAQMRTKKQASQAAGPPAESAFPPQRITRESKGNISIKRAKGFVQRREDQQTQSFRQRIPSSYRRTPPTEEERLEDLRQREAQALSKSQLKAVVSLNKYYGTLGFGSEPVVLIDAHNVLGTLRMAKNLNRKAERREKKRRASLLIEGEAIDEDTVPILSSDEHEVSRETLQGRLSTYSTFAQMRVVVVWDALGGATSVTTRERIHGIDVVFCGNTDADFFLIQEASRLRDAGAADVVVVTSDGSLRDSIGIAHVIKASALIRELDKTDAEMTRMLKEQQLQSMLSSGSVGDGLDPGIFQQLQDLRQLLPRTNTSSPYQLRKTPKPRPSRELRSSDTSSTD